MFALQATLSAFHISRFDGTSPVIVHKPRKSSPTNLFTQFPGLIFVSDNVKLSKFF